jgi:hypothetical protein
LQKTVYRKIRHPENQIYLLMKANNNVFGSDEHNYVWRKPREELRENNSLLPVTYGGGSFTVCGCMEALAVGNLNLLKGIMNKHVYVNVLRVYLKASAEKLGIQEHFAFYHNNYPKYSVYFVSEWCLYNCPKVIKTPPRSPDFNVIKNL